jgi:hypothetical protein
MRFFFHIVRTWRDDQGAVLSSPAAAMLQGAVVAAELAGDQGWDQHVVHVVDERGQEVGRVPVLGAAEDVDS